MKPNVMMSKLPSKNDLMYFVSGIEELLNSLALCDFTELCQICFLLL